MSSCIFFPDVTPFAIDEYANFLLSAKCDKTIGGDPSESRIIVMRKRDATALA